MPSNCNPRNVLFEAKNCQKQDSMIKSLTKIISISVLTILFSQWINASNFWINEAQAQEVSKYKPFEQTNVWKTEKKFWKLEEKIYRLWQKLKKWEKHNVDDWYFDSLGKLMDRFNTKSLELKLQAIEAANAIIDKI